MYLDAVLPSTDTLGYGFGIYKANFLTLFDPIPNGSLQIWSMFIPDIKNNTGEHKVFLISVSVELFY